MNRLLEAAVQNPFLRQELAKPQEVSSYSRTVDITCRFNKPGRIIYATQNELIDLRIATTSISRSALQRDVGIPFKMEFSKWNEHVHNGQPDEVFHMESRQMNSAAGVTTAPSSSPEGSKMHFVEKRFAGKEPGMERKILDIIAGCPNGTEDPLTVLLREFTEEALPYNPRTHKLALPFLHGQSAGDRAVILPIIIRNYTEAVDAGLKPFQPLHELLSEIVANANLDNIGDYVEELPSGSQAPWVDKIPKAHVTTVSRSGEESEADGGFLVHKDGPEFIKHFTVPPDIVLTDLEVLNDPHDPIKGALNRRMIRVGIDNAINIRHGIPAPVEIFDPLEGYIEQIYTPDPETPMKNLAITYLDIIEFPLM